MAVHDYVIANQSGAATRQDINNALLAIVSNNSSATAPATTYAFQFWFDTSNNILKIRNAANSAWIDWITTTATVLLPDGAVGSPSLTFASETDSGIYKIADNAIGIATSGTERVEISDTGIIFNEGGAAAIDFRVESDNQTHMFFVDAGNDRVGIGEDQALDALLVIKGDSDGAATPSIRLKDGTDAREAWISNSAGDLVLVNGGNDNVPHCQITLFDGNIIQLNTANTERARIDADGRLLVGHNANQQNQLQQISSTNGACLGLYKFAANDDGAELTFFSSRHATVGSHTVVNNGDYLGRIFFRGSDGAEFLRGAEIAVRVDGAPGDDDIPGRIEFLVTADGSDTPSEAMRIHNGREVSIGTTSTNMLSNSSGGGCVLSVGGADIAATGNVPANFNRSTEDGTIVTFRSEGNNEGSVSISGSTCSFNGGHLSRWTQLAGGAARTEILRGTVLSNLDEMCVWSHAATPAVLYTAEDELPEGVEVGDVKTPARAAYTEDNEQLNRMKVSDVEGDPNVAGVFQCWDDDDDTYVNDFFCAMTGDFVIRIAEGTTVARGDLLMSAGDGTAKPQDDDIIRSKTIAKVTSTVVSTTHADGSYCVPCVLMAC